MSKTKKIELLSPAGNMECLKAAIAAGCDAVYLGGRAYGARAFSKNFSDEEIISAINYAHLYGVKVYVTMNTLVYENETTDFLNYVEFLHNNNVDAIILQDFGMFDLIRKTFPNLELHASTQMHIHNLDGTQLMEKLGMKRVVLARETSIDEIKHIKENSNIDLEIFIHGALCISYSGQCLMSSLIGGRSGNRGTCAGSCRLKYDIINNQGKKLNINSYPLSTKDLNGLEYIKDLIDAGVTSLKIEGRMKSKEYVYMVTSIYRQAIDNYYQTGKVTFNEEDLLKLKKIFNRQYTKGFLNNAQNHEIINDYRPNHQGVEIGKVINYHKGQATIKLTDTLTIGSGLRVIGKKEDVGINVNDFYINNHLVKIAHPNDIITIKVNSPVTINSKVLITTDAHITNEINEKLLNFPKKIPIDMTFTAKHNNPLSLTITDYHNTVTVTDIIPEIATNNPTPKETIENKLSKLGDTIYIAKNIHINLDDNLFIPIKNLNELRRQAISELNNKRLYQIPVIKKEYTIDIPDFKKEKLLTCLLEEPSSINKLNKHYDEIFSEDNLPNTIPKLPRVIHQYPESFQGMVGEIGAFNHLTNLYTDFSLNVTNSYTVAFLHSLGAKRITLSYELTDKQIIDLINNYHSRYHKHPNLELITTAHEEIMISKYLIPKTYQTNNLYLRDTYRNLYKIKEKHHLMYIYNYKKRDNFNKSYYDLGINSLRINL